MTRYKFSNIKMLGAVAVALGIMGCTDTWDDHYKTTATFDGNLWEAVNTNPDLSNFASVLKACGYDSSLVSSQMYTVFAPVNASFSADDASALIASYNDQKASGIKKKDNTVIKEFIQNHIALYNYSVSSLSDDSIVMMNGKYLPLTASTVGGQSMRLGSTVGNGILYTLDNKMDYSPNVFEYLKKDADLDSVAAFLYDYNKYEFMPSLSVPGDIIDGKTHYLDSVEVLENKAFAEINAYLTTEDSTYWLVAPTNEIWNTMVPEYEQYFVYDKSVNKGDSLQRANARMALLKGSTFSRTLNPDASVIDSAMSTMSVRYEWRKLYYGTFDARYYQYDKPYETGGVFSNVEKIACSNGIVMKPQAWNIDKRQTFYQTIIAEAETSARLDSVKQLTTSAPAFINVQSSNPFYNKISGNMFAQFSPARGASQNIMMVFNVPDVLSNIGYDIYLITVPALAADTLASATERLATKFRARLAYNNEFGKQPAADKDYVTLKSTLSTTPDQVDTLLLAEDVKIPYCSWGTTPQVKLILDTRVSNSEVRDGKFNRILNIDCIIFKPHGEE